MRGGGGGGGREALHVVPISPFCVHLYLKQVSVQKARKLCCIGFYQLS